MSKKSVMMGATGVLNGIYTRLVQETEKAGGTIDDLHILTTPAADKIWPQIVALILGGIKIVFRFVAGFDRDMSAEGWKLESDVDVVEGRFELPELVEFLQEEESSIHGEEMLKRAKAKDCLLGQRHAEAFLRNQEAIPEEYRKYYLVFPGTVWVDLGGDRFVPYLYWGGGRWCLGFSWLVLAFPRRVRLVRSSK